MLRILEYWQPIVASFITLCIAYILHDLHVIYIEAKHRRELESKVLAVRYECKRNQEISEGVSHELQAKAANRSAHLERLLKQNVIVPIATNTSRIDAPNRPKYVAGNGIDASSFYRYGYTAEEYREKVDGFQTLIKEIYKANGQWKN